jgi:uncharacterized protein (DUF58 family)
MPTKRAWTLFALALILYFLANQTQVGWIYIVSDGLIGLLIAAFFYSRGTLKSIQASRTFRNPSATPPTPISPAKGDAADILEFAPPTFHEDDPIEVTLHFKHTGFRPAWQVSGLERCPFALPTDQAQPFFIPGLVRNQPINLTYQTQGDRRGLYAFSQLPLHSRGPFGLFHLQHTLTVPTEVLIYPAYHPLKRLRVFEKREIAEQQSLRIGRGSQIIGTREYHPGDSLRQVHWRSTARLGKLVVKEFTDDDQPAMTVVLDLQRGSNVGQGKFSTFETAIRMAASLGYYATRKNIPFRLVASSKEWTPPATPLSWWAILNYLAKVESDGQESLAHVLSHLPALTFVVVLINQPNEATARALLTLPQPDLQVLAFFITPNGAMPPAIPTPRAANLTIKSVSPHNWADVLVKL